MAHKQCTFRIALLFSLKTRRFVNCEIAAYMSNLVRTCTRDLKLSSHCLMAAKDSRITFLRVCPCVLATKELIPSGSVRIHIKRATSVLRLLNTLRVFRIIRVRCIKRTVSRSKHTGIEQSEPIHRDTYIQECLEAT